MIILGITAYFHDSSICLIKDGEIIFAIQEERLSRIKHDANFPHRSITEALRYCQLTCSQIDEIVFFEKPFLKFERLLETYLAFSPKGFRSFMMAMPLWLDKKLFQKKIIGLELEKLGFTRQQAEKIYFSEHHLSHAASAFYPSPFKEAIILTMDGVGEWATTSVSIGINNKIYKKKEIHFPHSLGMLYSAFTYFCGFKVNSGEYKLMGLAPYGEATYSHLIKEKLINIYDDGSFTINMEYFDYCTGLTMTNAKFEKLFKSKVRQSEEKIEKIHLDLAASIQAVTEEIIIKIAKNLKIEFGIENLCLAGGVALNCVANGKLYNEKIFQEIYIQPASGDAGGAIGAALSLYYDHFKNERIIKADDSMEGAYLGTSYKDHEIEPYLENYIYKKFTDQELLSRVADYLVKGMAIGWFQGRSEFGPRSLGNRSILADARDEEMQKNLNLKIKFRESFRPFAPAVLEEDVNQYFEFDEKSPYMLMVAPVKKELRETININSSPIGLEQIGRKRSTLPAVTHVDYSARIQTVNRNTNTKFYELIEEFKKITNCSVLVNTSFNIRGEPIVNGPEDALRCFMGTNLDVLVLENFVLLKNDQKEEYIKSYLDHFELD